MGLSGCELAKIGDPIVVSDVEEEFYIAPIEKLDPDQRSLEFRIQTIKPEPCLNTHIDIDVTKSGNNLSISLQDIILPDDCVPGEIQAQATADMGPLPNGFYNLAVDLKETVFNKGRMNIFEDRYFIDMESTNGFTLLHSNLFRVPEATIWGYITYADAADKTISDNFLADLSAISRSRPFNNGYYGHFQVADNGQKVDVRNAPQTSFIKSFLFEYTGEDQALQELADLYREEFPEKIEIRIFTDEGEVF